MNIVLSIAFLTSGDFNNTTGANLTNVEFLIIGGGGGGGNGSAADIEGGGGGAGALYSTDPAVPSPQRASVATVSPGPNTITVGAGGVETVQVVELEEVVMADRQ